MKPNENSTGRTSYMALAAAFFMGCLLNNYIKNTSQESQGAIHPSKLELKIGQNEVTMNLQGTNYVVVLGKNGKPKFQAYETKPIDSVRR